MSLVESFRDEVEDFLALTGATPTKFGLEAVGDPNFVFDLRDGRAPRADTIDKVRAFIKGRASAARSDSEAAA